MARWLGLSFGLFFAVFQGLLGQEAVDLAKENAELKKRVEGLEQSLNEVKGLLKDNDVRRLKAQNLQLQAQVDGLQSAMTQEKISEKLGDPVKSAVTTGDVLHTKYRVDLYGCIKLDMAYDDQRTDNGNFPRWVNTEARNEKDSQFNATARQTRLGFDFTGPEGEEIKTTAKIETDFYGDWTDAGEENRPVLMMRHAYMNLDWKKMNLSVLAGQTSDLFSPLVAPTLNYTVLWWMGNIGYRRPQLRVTKVFEVDKDLKVILAGAAARNIGRVLGNSPGDTGEDSGYPSFQQRTAVSFKGLGTKPTVVGLSGHFGQESYDDVVVNAGHSRKWNSWSINLDYSVPLHEKFALTGELYHGQNLDSYLGGIGQGINNVTLEEITTTGGWAALSIGPWRKFTFNVGAGMDNPTDSDCVSTIAPAAATTNRCLNTTAFGNVLYDINQAVRVGFEVQYSYTQYRGLEDGDSLRYHLAFSYNF